jgi:hypothetical protein
MTEEFERELEQDMGYKDYGETPKKKSKHNNDDDIVYTSFLETEDYILEQITNATRATHATCKKPSNFIIYSKKTGIIETKPEFVDGETLYRPIADEMVDRGIIQLPSGVEEYESTDKLVEEIKSFMYKYFEVPKFFADFLPYIILYYWVSDKFPFVPYVHFVGRTGTGKSTAMEVMGSICYKPLDVSGAITLASIFRISSQWQGTLMLDEFNPGGESYAEMLSLLKAGVSDRAILRVEGEKKREVKAYMMKSPKIFTSEKPVSDAGFRSRIIEIKMELNKLRVPLYKQKTYLNDAVSLRNKLLLWRLHKYDQIDLSEMEYGFPELQGFQGRVQQVITPIYYIADTESRKKILEFAKEQEEETLRQRRESIDGQIFEIILENHKSGALTAVTDLTEKLNKGIKMPMSEKKIANMVRKIVGFDIQRTGHDNVSTIITDNDKINELCAYYGYELPEILRVASVASVADESFMEEAETIFTD